MRGVRRARPRPTITALVLVAVLAVGAVAGGCGGDGGEGAAADRPAGTTGTTQPGADGGSATTAPPPDVRARGRLTGEQLTAWSGNAPAVVATPDELGLRRRPGTPGRHSPVAGVGETAIAVTDPQGTKIGCCVMTAVTVPQRERGLMQVTDFAGFAGMLFVWQEDTDSGFWMRNTPTPLSIAWFAADGSFVSSADMAPCGDVDTCPTYGPAGPYRFALEVPQGDLATLGIGPGSTLAVGGLCRGRPA
jgi:uncharacterized membrane protein (UPF0127 family)